MNSLQTCKDYHISKLCARLGAEKALRYIKKKEKLCWTMGGHLPSWQTRA